MSSRQNMYVDLRLKFLRPKVEGVATQIWVATHYLRIPGLWELARDPQIGEVWFTTHHQLRPYGNGHGIDDEWLSQSEGNGALPLPCLTNRRI